MEVLMNLSEELLHEYRDSYRIPTRFLRELEQRKAFPEWAINPESEDWLGSLHKAVTEMNWPEKLTEARAGLLERGGNLGSAVSSEQAKAIVMPVCTPAYLRSLMNIINLPMVFPNSSDPNAKMLFDQRKVVEAVHQLGHLSGMLEETGYLDAPRDYWGGAVTLGARFLYYHELGHLSQDLSTKQNLPNWIVAGEEYLVEELLADQFALSMLVMELKNHEDLQFVGFSGIVLALSFMALKEFSEKEYEGGTRRIKNAMLRMQRQFWWGGLSVKMGGISEEAILLEPV
jgi:hypothetical protein